MCFWQTMEDSLKLLFENPTDVLLSAATVLMQCTSNIIREPDNMKYRRIRIAKIQTRLLPVSGALECLFSAGFEEDGEFFTLPAASPLDQLQKLHTILTEKCRITNTTCLGNVPVRSSDVPISSTNVPASHTNIPSSSSNVVPLATRSSSVTSHSETLFYGQLMSYIKQVGNYMKPGVLDKARTYIPLNELKKTAENKSRHLGPNCSVEDQLLLELLAWFKESFFQWMDSPSCSSCHGKTQSRGHVAPTQQELAYQAGRVEQYQCTVVQCGALSRFPRYNDPLRLMETRVGRCGEWANCFTLCCLAVGLEARFVVDWTDHVWTEVYSNSMKRWLHADPCENACDKPLLYEAGWGKKLSYVIAIATDDIQDVTWRYTSHADDVLERRTLCRESWLVHVIVELRNKIQNQREAEGQLTAQRRALLTSRTIAELVEMMTDKTVVTEGLGGRTTGSMEWRQARGETGRSIAALHVISPTCDEVEARLLELKYSCARDEYVRVAHQPNIINGWQNLAYESKGVFRKVEKDWKMAYIARNEGEAVGSLTWKFELASRQVCVDKLEVLLSDACFENGVVRWTVCGNGMCVLVGSNTDSLNVVDVITGCTEFTIHAHLQGGNGQHSWQHSQLFRQKLDDSDFPLHIKVHLKRLQ